MDYILKNVTQFRISYNYRGCLTSYLFTDTVIELLDISYIELLLTLTKIPACENATGIASIPVDTLEFIMCIIVPKFLQETYRYALICTTL